MTKTETPQVNLWKGGFGDSYTDRNVAAEANIQARARLWASILDRVGNDPPQSILEIGSNVGDNLRAISRVSSAHLYAVEPNDKARAILLERQVAPVERIMAGTASSIALGDRTVDLALTSGVLIHIHPDDLLSACREIFRVSRRYIACAEYFSPQPEEIPYRGETRALFRRDFGAFWLENFSELQLVDYGFAWKLATGLDNLTWWLFRKP